MSRIGAASSIFPTSAASTASTRSSPSGSASGASTAVAIDYFGRTAGWGSATRTSSIRARAPHDPGGNPGRRRRCRLASSITGHPGAIFTVGFCFGGRHSGSPPRGHGLAGAVGFYGTTGRSGTAPGADPARGRVSRADPRAPGRRRPGHHRGRQRRIRVGPRPRPAWSTSRDLRARAPSFFDRTQEQFAEASADAWNRTLELIERHGQ